MHIVARDLLVRLANFSRSASRITTYNNGIKTLVRHWRLEMLIHILIGSHGYELGQEIQLTQPDSGESSRIPKTNFSHASIL